MVIVYILGLEQGKYYVGKTDCIEERILNHFEGDGAAWTQLYKIEDLLHIHENCDPYDEDKYTIQMMEKYGINNVRGGSFCQIQLNESDKKTILKMFNSINNKCYLCGCQDHFISECPEKNQYIVTTVNGLYIDNTCYKCGKKGHWAKDCFLNNKKINWQSKNSKNYNKLQWIDSSDDDSDDTSDDDVYYGKKRNKYSSKKNKYLTSNSFNNKCYKCGKTGHWANECYSKGKKYIKK
jgi:hypothetical protein